MKQVLDQHTEAQTRSEASSGRGIAVSVVVPVVDGSPHLREVFEEYRAELDRVGFECEFIFVLDGVGGRSLEVLRELKSDRPEITVVTLNRKFGESAALSVGFDRARHPIIVTLVPYYQIEPSDITLLINELLHSDKDLILSRRYPRIDSIFNRAQSRIFHWLTRFLTGTEYRDLSCGVRAMKREVVQDLQLYGDLHRFFPLLVYQRGFRVAEIPVRQSPRDSRPRVYNPVVYLRRLLDVFTLFFLFKFTKRPLRFFGVVGSLLLGSGGLITGYLGFHRLFGLGGIAGRPLLVLGVLLMVVGVQLLSIGLLGEIIIFTHARQMKDHTVERTLD